MKKYISFNHKEANFRLSSPGEAFLISAIIKNRTALDSYVEEHPEFIRALSPVSPGLRGSEIPEIAARMHRASDITGLGPMASVAGGFAQTAVEAAAARGASRAVVENGGDICLISPEEIYLGIHSGPDSEGRNLAFRIPPAGKPLAICSSSSTMGHSMSFGNCDLAVVTGSDGFITDSAATLACNMVRRKEDIQETLESILSLEGIEGILIFFRDRIGMAGDLPELVKSRDQGLKSKITIDIGYKGNF